MMMMIIRVIIRNFDIIDILFITEIKITASAWFNAIRRFVKYFKKYSNTHFSQSI